MDYAKLKNVTPVDFMGLAIRDPAPASLTSASVALIDVPPGTSHPRAKSTRSDKLYVCVSGSLVFLVEDVRIEVGPLDLVVVARDEWFGYENPGEHAARLLLVHVPPFDLENEVLDAERRR